MSTNGIDTDGKAHSGHSLHVPLEVEVSRPPASEPRSTAASFSMAQIARKVPATKPPTGIPLVHGHVSRNFRESFREMRFGLEQLRERTGVRTIAVVSVHDGEGKSLTAVNLAVTLTEGGRRRVALIDANFGDSRIPGILEAEAPLGLAEVLAGKIPAERAMFAAEPNGLYAMSAGSLEGAGLDPLDVADAFGTLANRLATVFDYVLVDTPSLSHRIDGAALAVRLDGAVIVVRAGLTKLPELDQAIARLGEGRVLGLVLNKAR